MVESPVFIKLTPEGIRTPDLLVRSQTLYPTELPAQIMNALMLKYYNILIYKMQAFFANHC